MNFSTSADGTFHGIATLPSDNIKNIVNHDFEKDYISNKNKKDQDQLIKLLMKEENVRSQETKASIMRNQAIQDKMVKLQQKDMPFKLKQFDEVKPSSYISDTTKEIRKKYKDSMKKSNIETDSVLKIAELTSQAKEEPQKERPESKQRFMGEQELQKLQEKGNEIHKYDSQYQHPM